MDISKLAHKGARRGLVRDLLGEDFVTLEKEVRMGKGGGADKACYLFAMDEMDLVCKGHAGKYALHSPDGLFGVSKNKRDLVYSFDMQNGGHMKSYFLGVIGGDPSGESVDLFEIGDAFAL